MPTTPIFGLEYPGSSGHARLWEWFQALAEDIDTAFARPVFRARRAAAQSIGTASETTIQWDTEDFDTQNGHDLVTNPTRYVVQKAGYYQIGGGCGWSSNATGRRGVFWRKNGTTMDGTAAWWVPGINGNYAVSGRAIVQQFAVNDFIEMAVFQESGVSLNTAAGASMPSIDIVYVGPA